MNSITIELKEPFDFKDQHYDKLTLGKFKAKHYQYIPDELFDQIDENDLSNADKIKIGLKMMPLIAAMADVPEEVIGELCPEDFNKIQESLGPFLEQSLKTGGS